MNKKRVIGLSFVLVITITIAIVATIGIIGNKTNSNIANTKVNVTINVFDKENSNIYNKSIETNKEYLLEILNDTEELNVVTEDSQYGAYITSIMGIEQGDNYYWSYYIDGEYASVGVSNCEVEDGKTYDFKIEKFEY